MTNHEKIVQELEDANKRIKELEEGIRNAMSELKEFGIPQMAGNTLKKALNSK